jgi:hypothetical protein
MSRTYRRKENSKRHYSYYFLEHESITVRTENGTWYHFWVKRDKLSKEYIKDKAKFHADCGTFKHKEPGPSWFRNVYTERPQRREAKRQLHKYLLDQEFEVILNPKDKLEYWT